MTVPQGLFMDAPEFEDSSLSKLSDDPNVWAEELTTKLYERIPAAQGLSVVWQPKKLDEETGTATGSLLVSNAKGKCNVPVIIKEFNLYPLDVFFAQNKTLPLNQESFLQAMDNQDAFKGLQEYPNEIGGMDRFDNSSGNLMNSIYPPNFGRYSYASVKYPILEELIGSGTINGKKFAEFMKARPELIQSFNNNNHLEMIKKVAAAVVTDSPAAKPAVAMIFKSSPTRYSILETPDETFNPTLNSVPLSRTELIERISKISPTASDDIHEIDRNGERLIVQPVAGGSPTPWIEGNVDPSVTELVEPGYCKIRRKDGIEVEGMVLTDLRTLYNQSFDSNKIFVGKNGITSIQPKIIGIKIEAPTYKPEFQDIKTGQTGIFIGVNEDNLPYAITPVTITSVARTTGNEYEYMINAVDMIGMPVSIAIPFGNSRKTTFMRVAKIGSTFVLPKGMKWLPITSLIETPNSIIDYTVKQAAHTKTANAVRVIYNGADRYSIKGLDKYASEMCCDKTNMTSAQTKFLIASLGGGNIANDVIKTAQIRTMAIVHGLKQPRLQSEKCASVKIAKEKIEEVCANYRSNLIKQASQMENTQSVDVLLALNFINPENINKFIGKIPAFKATISALAGMLIGARLGVVEIPESACSTAMNRLVEVVNGLETLRASQEGQ